MNNTLLKRIDTSHQQIIIKAIPNVNVLMSTYNGSKFTSKQIESIAGQCEVTISLTIRDDGSNDRTPYLAKKVSGRYRDKNFAYNISCGANLGFLDSFEKLLLDAEGSEYYAFSDQDDLWEPCKLAKAVAALQPYADEPALYASSVSIADEKLQPLSKNVFPGLQYTIPAEFIRHRLAGHTMVWNEALQKRIRQYGAIPVWSHDQHVALVGLLTGAPLLMDTASYVKHRRLNTSLTPGGGSAFKRLKHEWDLIINRGNKFNRPKLATRLLELPSSSLGIEDRTFLNLVSSEKRIPLLFNPSLSCGIIVGDLEAKLSILLGRF